MTAPQIVSYSEPANWYASGARACSPSISWQAGDLVIVVSGDEDGSTLSAPSCTGLSFSPLGSQLGQQDSSCGEHMWIATPGAPGGPQAVTGSAGGSGKYCGSAVWVIRSWNNSPSPGYWRTNCPGTGGYDANHYVDVTRQGNDSIVILAMFDWAATNVSGTAWNPTAKTVCEDSGNGTQYGVHIFHWADAQGAPTGTQYSETIASTGAFTKLAIEVAGTAAGPVSANAGVAAATAAATAAAGQDGTGLLFAGAATGISGSWVDTGNAVGSTQGTYATWTDSGSGTSAVLELATFGVQAAVPSGATVGDVSVVVRHREDPATQVASVTAQCYLATTPYSDPQPLTVSASVHEDTVTVGGLTRADLADLRVRVTATRT